MTLSQLSNYVIIIAMVVVAIATGVDAALSFYIKKANEQKKHVPAQLLTIDEIAKFVVSEADTWDVSGAEKKEKAVQALLDQALKENKPLTESVAKGAVQNAYDQMSQDKNASKDNAATQDGEDAQPIGFVSDDDSND